MTGITEIWAIRHFEEKCLKMGFKIKASRHFHKTYGDVVALYAASPDHFPIYIYDAELFSGTIEQASQWLDGVAWGQNYYKMIGATTGEEVARKEQDQRNIKLIEAITSTREETE